MNLPELIEMGDSVSVLAALEGVAPDNLERIVEECNELYSSECKRIDELYKKDIFRPEVFFNPSVSKLIDEARDNAMMHVLAMTSEISAAAQYWLSRSKQPASRG